jgi:hypothetical protein
MLIEQFDNFQDSWNSLISLLRIFACNWLILKTYLLSSFDFATSKVIDVIKNFSQVFKYSVSKKYTNNEW